jgi:hypothetical protein
MGQTEDVFAAVLGIGALVAVWYYWGQIQAWIQSVENAQFWAKLQADWNALINANNTTNQQTITGAGQALTNSSTQTTGGNGNSDIITPQASISLNPTPPAGDVDVPVTDSAGNVTSYVFVPGAETGAGIVSPQAQAAVEAAIGQGADPSEALNNYLATGNAFASSPDEVTTETDGADTTMADLSWLSDIGSAASAAVTLGGAALTAGLI